MNQRLIQALENHPDQYILPFFWQHGEDAALLREGIQHIRESGIGAVCIESRPHPDFLGEKWWHDLDTILDEAKRLEMKVWILDDAHFPSGMCNGKITADSPYGKDYLTHVYTDIAGPLKGHAFMVYLRPGEKLLGVVLGRIDRKRPDLLTDLQDLTACVADGKVYADIPVGTWSLMVLKTTRQGTGRKNYINAIDRDAVRYFIDTVYAPHYAHYASDFGTTFAGFFSDEPEIGNGSSEHNHHLRAGQPDISLPWSAELEQRLRKAWGSDFAICLASLFAATDAAPSPQASANRVFFTDQVADLYGKNFCGQIGDWCRAHGVEYIGHVIEDDGRHAQLGLGTAHYFRALWGQDMAGIDVVLQQLRPELDDYPFHTVGGINTYNGEFFHYGLAGLGVSLARLDPKKRGRTVCEVFGAYGWAEGLKQMKWILDHMMVSGVNHFVPHAFTMKDFPDPDCPPHFYARGNNPQYPYFRHLMEYTQRVCHLISGGKSMVSAAILYTAEQEWAGEVIQFEKAARELSQACIGSVIVPADFLAQARVSNGFLYLDDDPASAVPSLIISQSTWMPAASADAVIRAAEAGLRVFCYGDALPRILEADGSVRHFPQGLISLVCEGNLAHALCSHGILTGITVTGTRFLRSYRYLHEDAEFILLFNESTHESIQTSISSPASGRQMLRYDPWTNTLRRFESECTLTLSPFELQVLVLSDPADPALHLTAACMPEPSAPASLRLPECGWEIALCEAGTDALIPVSHSALGDLSRHGLYPYFSGTIRYQCTFHWSANADPADLVLSLGEVYETADVKLNGVSIGVRVAPPYCFSVGHALRPGTNVLEILVVNTLVHRLRDPLSMTMPMEPTGLIGPVTLSC